MDTVSGFTVPEALTALDFINDAKEETLDSRHWSFDEREGVLDTFAVRNGVDDPVYVAYGLTPFIGTTSYNATIGGPYTIRAVPTDSPDRSRTAHRVEGVATIPGVISGLLAEAYSGTTGNYAWDLFAAEYQFPSHSNGDSKVKRLLSMTHHERPLRLKEMDKNFTFDSLITRLHESLGRDPEFAYFGRPVWNTHTASITGNTQLRDGVIIWPVPMSSERLNYTYLYAHPLLDTVDDTLVQVPDRVINAMVELAYGFSLASHVGNDVERSQRVMASALTRIDRLHAADRKMPYKSKPVPSLDSIGNRNNPSLGREIPDDNTIWY